MAIRNLMDAIDPKDAKRNDLFIIREIDKFFEGQANINGNRDSGGFFRPSGITECARLNLYNFLNVAPFVPPDLGSMRRMFRGTEHHRIWYDIFVAAGLKVRGGDNDETLINCDDPTIFGHYDWILEDDNGIEYLIEWKSTEYLNSRVSWGHNVQWNLYSHMLGIPRGFVIKENPATLEILPIEMSIDETFTDEILNWLRMIEDHARRREMLDYASKCGPKRPWKQTCPIYEFCHSDLGDSPWDIRPLVDK